MTPRPKASLLWERKPGFSKRGVAQRDAWTTCPDPHGDATPTSHPPPIQHHSEQKVSSRGGAEGRLDNVPSPWRWVTPGRWAPLNGTVRNGAPGGERGQAALGVTSGGIDLVVGGRNRFFAYNSARRGSSGLKLGGLVGLFGPVRTRPAPTSWAVRFRCHGGLCPNLCGAVARPSVGLSTRAGRLRIGAGESCRTSPVLCRSSPPRRSYSRSKFQLWGPVSPGPEGG